MITEKGIQKRVTIVRFIKDVACIDIISFPSRDMEPLMNYFLAKMFRVRALFSILFTGFLATLTLRVTTLVFYVAFQHNIFD